MSELKTRIRVFPKNNYKAFFANGRTIRIFLDHDKPMTTPKYPEFLDIDVFETLNGLCDGGCRYCYLNGNRKGKIVTDAVEKLHNHFATQTLNERPFQVALPGSGELFLHPDWEEILKTISDLGIVPNYTTHGMSVVKNPDKILEVTKKYVGGVAVTCHPHLEKFWRQAIPLYKNAGIDTNLHIIISDEKSIDRFYRIFDEFKDIIDHVVLLPLGAPQVTLKGEVAWDYFISKYPTNTKDKEKLAYGANLFPYISKTPQIEASIYDPEMFGGFLALDKMKIYKSSFNLQERPNYE